MRACDPQAVYLDIKCLGDGAIIRGTDCIVATEKFNPQYTTLLPPKRTDVVNIYYIL